MSRETAGGPTGNRALNAMPPGGDGTIVSQRAFLLLTAVLLTARFATLSILPLLDPSEARYALVARDMLEGGDFVTPMIWANGEHVPFFSKPPLAFWLQAASMSALEQVELAARLPSFLAAVAMLFVIGWLLRRRFGPDLRRSAVLILLSMPLFFLSAGIGLTDMILCLAVGGALFSHYAFTCEADPARRRRQSLLTFAFLGMGMLTKGPVALVQFGLPVLLWTIWNRRGRDFTEQAWWPGLLVFALPWVPWFLLTERANPGFLAYFFVTENFLRYLSPDFPDPYGGGHAFPFGTAILFFLLAALPWLVLLGWRMREPGARVQVRRAVAAEDLRFFWWAVLANVAFLSFSRHILGTYLLPVLPATAVLLAAAFAGLDGSLARVTRAATALVALYTVAIVAASPVVRDHWSNERLVARATAFQQERGAGGRLVFVEKRPFSARFYGTLELDYVPWNAGNEHYRWYLEPGNGHLLVIPEKFLSRMRPYVTDRLRLVDRFGAFSLWEPIPPPAGAQSTSEP